MITLRVGSRPSPLAMKQAEMVALRLRSYLTDVTVEIVCIESEGDVNRLAPLSEIGGKGVFIRSIEKALLDNKIDIAVHSFKDVTAHLLEGLNLYGFLAPESPRDTVISKEPIQSLGDLPKGAVIATGSLRRKMQLNQHRPDIQTQGIRGNVQTRLDILHNSSDIDAIMLSEVGLLRLQCPDTYLPLDPEYFIPAPGQGVIALECRDSDSEIQTICHGISDIQQLPISFLEWQFLKDIEFDCSLPIGLYIQKLETEYKVHLFATDAEGKKRMQQKESVPEASIDSYLSTLAQDVKQLIQT